MVLEGTISKIVLQEVMVLRRTSVSFKEPFKNPYCSVWVTDVQTGTLCRGRRLRKRWASSLGEEVAEREHRGVWGRPRWGVSRGASPDAYYAICYRPEYFNLQMCFKSSENAFSGYQWLYRKNECACWDCLQASETLGRWMMDDGCLYWIRQSTH